MPPSQAAALNVDSGRIRPSGRLKISRLLWVLAIPALWWVLRAVPFRQIAAALTNLHGWQIAVLVMINLGVIAVFSLRWWILVGALGGRMLFFRAVGYHLAGFGVSYFTAGPQVGGEPLQVILASQNQSVKFPAAVSSVFLDKFFQLLTNFIFLLIGSVWIFSRGILGKIPGAGLWVGAGIVLVLPLLHLLALRRGVFPLSQLIQRLPRLSRLEKFQNVIEQSEELISRMLQGKTIVIFTAAIISIVGWLLTYAEYTLMVRFLGGTFTTPQVIMACLASQLAFLTPLPGGLGALEASQVMMFTSFGAPAAIGLSVSVLMRARDVLFGLLGVVIATKALNNRFAQSRAVPIQEK